MLQYRLLRSITKTKMQEHFNSPKETPDKTPDKNVEAAMKALESFTQEASKKAHQLTEEMYGKRDPKAEKVIEALGDVKNERNREFNAKLRESFFKMKFYGLLAEECAKRVEKEAEENLKKGYEELAKQSKDMVASETAKYENLQKEWEKAADEEADRLEKGYDEMERGLEEQFNKTNEEEKEKARKDPGREYHYYEKEL